MVTAFDKKYRKPHLIQIQTCFPAQRVAAIQEKTSDHIHLRSSFGGVLRTGVYEACRRVVARKLLRTIRFTLQRRAFVAVTAKPKEIRMGKGKGAYSHSVLPVVLGQRLATICWCHRRTLPRVVSAIQRSVKKAPFRFFF